MRCASPCARAFAREGAKVFLAGCTLAKLDAVVKDISAARGAAETAQVNALDEQAVEEHAGTVGATIRSNANAIATIALLFSMMPPHLWLLEAD